MSVGRELHITHHYSEHGGEPTEWEVDSPCVVVQSYLQQAAEQYREWIVTETCPGCENHCCQGFTLRAGVPQTVLLELFAGFVAARDRAGGAPALPRIPQPRDGSLLLPQRQKFIEEVQRFLTTVLPEYLTEEFPAVSNLWQVQDGLTLVGKMLEPLRVLASDAAYHERLRVTGGVEREGQGE